jgi:CubicO group peptidase (beta-lactamase class C family)
LSATYTVHGDEPLASGVAATLGRKHTLFGTALITPNGIRTAVKGADHHADFEIASISKGLTGLLFADAIERGELRPESTLGEFLPLGETAAARVPLGLISTHHSGLPALPKSAKPWRRSIELLRRGTNPYGDTLGQLLGQARATAVGKQKYRYSNFGFELLGHAIASAAGTTYESLLRDRLTAPLQLDGTYVPARPDALRATALMGTSRGKPMEPWTGEAIGPAGGIRSTVDDLARLAQAMLNGTAPGLAALDPIRKVGLSGQIGAAWLVTNVAGHTLTWHNGRSGGFGTWLGVDREAGTGIVILSATSSVIANRGFKLLLEASASLTR